MRYLLVVPRLNDRFGDYYAFPLGMGYISAVLKQRGFEVQCLNLNHHRDSDEAVLESYLSTHHVDVLCTGGLSPHYLRIKRILESAKRLRPEVLTVVGGGIVSSEPELMLLNLPIDVGVVGEGEGTVIDIAERLPDWAAVREVPGIVYRDESGAVVRTGRRKYIGDLDAVPFPDFEGFDAATHLDLQLPNDHHCTYLVKRPRMLPLITSRSCPFMCTFCYHPLGNKYRVRSLDNVFAEIDHVVGRYGVNVLAVIDELFAFDKDRIREFCARIAAYGLHWYAQLRVDCVDAEVLGMLADSGCFRISYGIESANDVILDKMRKKITVAQVEKALSLSRDFRIGIQGNLIFGDPHETFAHAKVSLDWWEAHNEYALNMGYIFAYPRSVLYADAVERGIIKDRLQFIADGCPVVNMSAMSDPEFRMLDVLKWRLITTYRCFAAVSGVRAAPRHPGRDVDLFDFEAVCPHCSAMNAYENFHVPDMSIMKISCTVCHQRFDVSPLSFLSGRKGVDDDVRKLFASIQDGRPVAVMPRVDEDFFTTVMENKCIPWNLMKMTCCLDPAPEASPAPFLGRAPVLQLTPEAVAKFCRDGWTVCLLVGPQAGGDDVRGMVEACGIPPGQIAHLADIARLAV